MKHLVKLGTESKNLTGKLIYGDVIAQPFIPKFSLLETVSIEFGTYCRNNTAELKFEIMDSAKNTVYTSAVCMSKFKDNVFHIFKPSIIVVPNETHYIKITGNGDTTNTVTAKYSNLENIVQNQLKLYINGRYVNGELSCTFTYSDIIEKIIAFKKLIFTNKFWNFSHGI